jgi:hypothetical protein
MHRASCISQQRRSTAWRGGSGSEPAAMD